MHMSMLDQLSSCRRGVPSCSGRPFSTSVPHKCHRPLARGRRRQQNTACDAGLTDVVANGLYTLSSSVQDASNVLATVSPSFIQPTFRILGTDLATTIALHPTWQGLSRLGVRHAGSAIPQPIVPVITSMSTSIPQYSTSCRQYGTSLVPDLVLSLASQTSMF